MCSGEGVCEWEAEFTQFLIVAEQVDSIVGRGKSDTRTETFRLNGVRVWAERINSDLGLWRGKVSGVDGDKGYLETVAYSDCRWEALVKAFRKVNEDRVGGGGFEKYLE